MDNAFIESVVFNISECANYVKISVWSKSIASTNSIGD